ncbi:hypothetical protein KY359_05830 [Candidatus Woesearchaeota archaeon]|nr:hypothetical protein [Candidatus Woesearchaeota archaeon]
MTKKTSLIDSIITDIEESRLLALVKSSFKSWYTHWPWILLSVLVDFLFLVSVSTVITLIQFTLFEHLEQLMTMMGEATGGLMNVYNDTATVSAGIMGTASSLDFQYHLGVIFKYLGIMVLSSFALWMVFQGISWYIAYRMSTDKNRLPFIIYWKNFALESVPFYLVSILLLFLYIRILFSIKMSMSPMLGTQGLDFFFVLLVVVTWYFGALCYSLTERHAYKNFKQCFVYGIKRFTKTIQSFIFIAVVFFMIDLILRIGFIRNDAFVIMVVGTLLFMPAVVFAKILLYRTAQEYWPAPPLKSKTHK